MLLRNHRLRAASLSLVLISTLLVPVLGHAQDASKLNPGLAEALRLAAREAEKAGPGGDLAPLEGKLMELIVLTTQEALTVGTVEDFQTELAETARTDVQVGNGPSSSGTTSLAETAGLASLLSFAIENGAIQRESRGTSMVLSTTPYALIAAFEGDSQVSYQKYGFWRRFGVSVAVAADDGGGDTLGNLSVEDISQVGLRVRLFGDRGARSAGFLKLWRKQIQPGISKHLVALSEASNLAFEDDPAMQKLTEGKGTELYDALEEAIQNYFSGSPAETKQERKGELANVIWKVMQEKIYEPIRAGELLTDPDSRRKLQDEVLPRLADAHLSVVGLRAQVPGLVADYNDSLHLLTLGYDLHRIGGGSDFSEMKLIYQHPIAPFDISLNGGISLNHDPSLTPGQATVRDYSFSGVFEIGVKNVIAGAVGGDNLRPIILSGSGRYARVESINDGIGSALFKVELPIFAGANLPVAMSYSSRTETSTSSEFKIVFGASIQLETMMAAARAMASGRTLDDVLR